MPDIQILSPHLADLIAAGEVVERPASVVKELVENAFDAGARTVTVELRGGGATYLRVTDDGCGMAPEDAGIAFLRHATSKLHDEQGLEAIGTMGFRGEALAAISAVSHITLTTRQRGAAAGTHMTLDAGDIQDMYETGCPEGTTMIVRDLFFNTPARRKFLKSDRAEGAACAAAALRCALGRPDVSVRCIRDGEEVFFSPGDNKLDSCVYSLLGRDLAMSLLPCAGEADGVRVHGFISSPAVPAEEAVAFRSPTASAFAAPRVAPPPAFVTPARPAPGTPPEPVVPVAQPAQTAIEQEPVIPSPLESAAPPAEPPARLIGEAMHTYILVEKGETLILIDKHAAHERINFDRLRQSPADIPSQTLLEPLPFTPDASDAGVLQQYGGLLAELGFTLEPFGRCDYILRGVPAQLDAADALPALEEICAQLRHGARMDAQSVRDEVLKTVACKAAIKAGWQTEPEELLRLADAVCAGEVKYCPHGRPVAVTLTRRELDKLFKRII